MRKLLGLGVALSLGAAGVIHAAESGKDPVLLAEKDRSVPAGRTVQVVLNQSEIATTIDLGRIAANAGGGGLIGGILVAAMDDRAKTMRRAAVTRAEDNAHPIRTALSGFDVQGLALGATQNGLGKPDWFQARPAALAKMHAPVAGADGGQIAYVDFWYGLSPDFSQIRVRADISIERVGKARGGVAPGPVFHHQLWSIVQLRKRSYAAQENAEQWSAEGGKRAKAALTTAFGEFEALIPRALLLGQKDVAAYTTKGREKAFGADFYGPLISRDPGNPEKLLLWSNGLVQVQTIG